MAFRSVTVWLEDISMTIDQIDKMIADTSSADEFRKSRMLVMAVERGLEIIAEALKNAIKHEPDLPISNKREIIGLRNLINHVYYEINYEKLWLIIKNDLPILKDEVKDILEDHERKLESNEL